MFGTQDILLIGIIVVVLFGATRASSTRKWHRTGNQEFQKRYS